VEVEIKVPQTGSFFNSPPMGTEGARGPLGADGGGLKRSENPFITIPMIERTTLITSTLAIR
jgi:hypothetical protein